MTAKRELMRVRIIRIVEMGYKEKDAILALEKYPSTLVKVKSHHILMTN